MKVSFVSATAAALLAGAAADSCNLIDGYYYCNQVNQVQYSNIGFSGSYNRITSMDGQSGVCKSEPFSFNGALSPFDEELSVHFRGPIKLNSFAVYSKGGSKNSREADAEPQVHHQHREAEPEPVLVTAYESVTYYVTVDEFGNLLTAAATQAPSTAAPAPAPSVTTSAAPGPAPPASSAAAQAPPAHSSAPGGAPNGGLPNGAGKNFNGLGVSSVTGPSQVTSTVPTASPKPVATGSGDWSRTGYYNADAGSANGVTFLNNLGGSGSGIFDYQFGNSLSYCAADGVSAASSPQVLSSTTVPSNKEFIIFSDSKCNGDDCGYYRDGTVAYHGFGGDEKIFLFDFEMPTESSVAPGSFNYDMPAIWLLNAQIPRTLQYGKIECSCWDSGCGELDLFEILSAGNTHLTTTLHDKQGGNGKGSSDYFARPTQGSLKAAVIFDGSTLTITTLDNSTDFPESLDAGTIQHWISSQSGSSGAVAF